ncbi:MAG: hypothetical protein J0M02_03380 [Planctomycetes bacterium]|nr:hypothetical protein [Planctomycetota bacterium]
MNDPGVMHCISWNGEPRLWYGGNTASRVGPIHAAYRGLRRFWDRHQRLPIPASVQIAIDMTRAWAEGPIEGWVVIIGANSPYRKIICMPHGLNARPLLVGKIPLAVHAWASIQREAETLLALAQRTSSIVITPRLLGLVPGRASFQSAITGRYGRLNPSTLGTAWLELLAADVSLPSRQEAIRMRLCTLQCLALQPGWDAALRPLIELGERLLEHPRLGSIPWGRAHRDLIGANTVRSGHQIGVCDWEHSDGNWSPLCDLLHEQALRTHWSPRLRLPAAVSRSDAQLLLDLHLLDTGSLYLYSANASGLSWMAGRCPLFLHSATKRMRRENE